MEDTFNLDRFLKVQAPVFAQVVSELKQDSKQTHWMWFIFPQLAGLGHSSTAQHYAIKNLAEAKAYWQHPILGRRLLEVAEILQASQQHNAVKIFGNIDAQKLKSSLTLFSAAAPEEKIFSHLLEKFFNGEKCSFTLKHI